MRRHKLLPKALLKRLPPLYSGEDKGLGALAVAKFFSPDSGFEWYASEGSPVDENGYYDTDKEKVDFLFFGLVVGLEVELGYFSLLTLEDIRGRWGLPVERDRFWAPQALGEVQRDARQRLG